MRADMVAGGAEAGAGVLVRHLWDSEDCENLALGSRSGILAGWVSLV